MQYEDRLTKGGSNAEEDYRMLSYNLPYRKIKGYVEVITETVTESLKVAKASEAGMVALSYRQRSISVSKIVLKSHTVLDGRKADELLS